MKRSMSEDELIEKVAEAIWLAEAARANRRRYILWADVGDTMRDNYRPLARAAISVIREALSEPSLQAEVGRLRVALALIAHECISRRPATAVQTVKDVRAIAHRAITLSYLRLQPDG